MRYLMIFVLIFAMQPISQAYDFSADKNQRDAQYQDMKKDMEYIKEAKHNNYKILSEKNKQKIELPKRDMRYNFMKPAPAPILIVK